MDKDPRKYTCPKCKKPTTCLVWGSDSNKGMCWDCFDKGNDKENR